MTDPTPLGIRLNNPGNIRRSKDPWQGLAEVQTDTRFFRFKTPVDGIRALARVLITYQDKHGVCTVRGIVFRYAPPAENNTTAYVDFVARRAGFHPDQALNLHNYDHLRPVVDAIMTREVGRHPYTDAQIDKALVMAGVEPPKPPSIQETRTVKAGRVAAAATTAGAAIEAARQVGDAVETISPALGFLQTIAQWTPFAAAALALAGIGYMIWARIDDRNRGLR